SDDSRYLVQCIADLGFAITAKEAAEEIRVKGLGGRIPKKEASVYVGSAGTAARFLTALLGLKEGVWHLDASEQMRRRPMEPLFSCLKALGTQVVYEGEEGHFPFTLIVGKREEEEAAASGTAGRQTVTVDIAHSSQFLSALLIASCCSGRDLDIRVKGTHGMAYIDMTVKMMEQFGIVPKCLEDASEGSVSGFRVEQGCYRHQVYEIEPDVSAACYFYAMAALLGIEGSVQGVHFDSLQGDVEFLRILGRMGCEMKETPEGIVLFGPEKGRLKGVEADMHACSDQAITLAAIAPYADSPVTITGIGHIRYQESDRLTAISQELTRLGIRVRTWEDGLTIWPGRPGPGKVHTYDDHRMAMGFSLTGLRADGIEIDDPGCCRKTFAGYFEVLDRVIGELAGK
ncbi:MAG TPA: 3-phosphoshikimate 1-carboxyvinyltransferase, partial [Candidatus Eisenbergiella stercorigallinarum]|nr:3-phosphoshikimate 1-carboxyvinyltransferase [Candidatus Eisenbergiella stercorigallinarum]